MSEDIWRNILVVVAAMTLPSLIAFVWASLRTKKEDPNAPRRRKRSPARGDGPGPVS